VTLFRARWPLRIPAVAVTALGLALAACGESRQNAGSTSTGLAPPATAGNARLTVSETEFSLAPAQARIAKAGMVTITARNRGTIQHALAVHASGGQVRTATIAPGGSAGLTVDLKTPGSYSWYCPLDGHRARGMRGTIVVGASGGSSNYPG